MTDNPHPVSDLARRLCVSAILFGLLTVILGVAVLAWPGPSILVAAGLFGVYLVVSGVAMVVLAFSLPVSAGSRFMNIISGALSVILGILAFRHFGQGYAILLLAIWIGIGFIFRGVTAVAFQFGDRGSRPRMGDLLRCHQHHRRCRGVGLPVRLDRDAGSGGRRLAGHPRRGGDDLRLRDAQRRQEGRERH